MRTEAQYLWDIIDAADAVDRFIGSQSKDQFLVDEVIRSAVHSKLMIIGEAVSRLTPGLTDRYPAIPWNKIRGFRNAIIHGYFKINWEIVWGTATEDAHQLRNVAEQMLKSEFPDHRPQNT